MVDGGNMDRITTHVGVFVPTVYLAFVHLVISAKAEKFAPHHSIDHLVNLGQHLKLPYG